MRKLMLLAAMLAMVLVAASPAFAQTAVAVGGDFDGDGVFDEFDFDDDNDGIFDGDEVEFDAVSQNVFDEINAVGVQVGNAGDLDAGDDLSQSIAQEQSVSVEVVNAGLDRDLDGILDAFDGDDDNDGISDAFEF